MEQIHWRATIVVLLVFSFAAFSTTKPVYAKDQIDIYWTDLGINQMQKGFKLSADFDDFDQDKRSTVIVGNRSGQMLIPMPSDEDLPTTDEGWNDLSNRIYEEIKQRAQNGLKGGAREFEIRTVQNINIGGYFNPVRQGNVVKFTIVFAKSLGRLRSDLDKEYTTNVQGVWASNGGYAASKALPAIARQVVDSGILVDARAWKSDVKELYVALGGKLAIINTAGDVPARYETRPIPLWHMDETMVAHHATARALKREIPGIKLYWVDAEGVDWIIAQHISFAHWSKKLEVKEYTDLGYQKLGMMTGGQLRKIIFGNPKADELGKLTEKITPDSEQYIRVPRKSSDYASPSQPPPPPPPPPGGAGGTVVGGVDIDVTPESAGKLDPRVKEQILKLRPSAEVLQRSVPKSEKEE